MAKIKGYIMKNNETKEDQKKPTKAKSDDKDTRTPSDIRREIYDEMLDMEMIQSSMQNLFH